MARRLLLPALALAVACYAGAGSQGDDEGGESGTAATDPTAGTGADDDGGDDGPATDCVTPQQRVGLLSHRRYGHAVRDLLGLAVAPTPSNGGGTHVGLVPAGPDQVDPSIVSEYNTIAQAAADEALESLATLAPCGEGDDELACATAFIADFGARAFRRPLTDAEKDGLVAVWQVGREQDETYAGGIRLVIVSVLQSPSFLYVTEIGEPNDAGHYALTPWEVASQISFFLLDSIPDAQLREAAEDGRLATDEGVAEQVDRLMATEEGRASVTGIVVRWLGSERVIGAEKQSEEFTPELRESMRLETEHFVDDLLWNGGGELPTLFTSTETFVDTRLAEFYGVTVPEGDGFTKVAMPADQRAGVLTHASLLASLSGVAETSVVYRGLFVARDLLCMEFEPPPAGASESGPDTSVGERARAEYRMSTAPCSGCHISFDPFGMLFEHYDELGRFRTTIGDVPVDASWDIAQPPSLAGHTETLVELAPKLAAADEVASCATQRVTVYATQRPFDLDLYCHVGELTAAFLEADRDLVELVRLVATSPVLRWRSASEDP